MSESFVDLSYRGLGLGKRIKLTQVRPSSGYLEVPAPMPVGTAIGIATEDGVLLEAIVAEIHEQTTGSERPPGMIVRPKLDADAARAWWRARVELPEDPRSAPDGKVTVTSRRDGAVPELVDDGRNTAVIEVIDQDAAQSSPGLVDDGKRTVMMDAVDLQALGLEPSATRQMAAVKPDDDDEGNGNGNGEGNGGADKPEGKSKKKKKKR